MLSDEQLADALANRMGPTVTKDSIEAQIVGETCLQDLGDGCGTLTIIVLELANGFTVTGESACADPANYDAEIGRKIARDNAVNKIWALEGYLLKERLYRTEVAAAENIGKAKLELSTAQDIRTMLLSIRDGIETDVQIKDLLLELDAAIQAGSVSSLLDE